MAGCLVAAAHTALMRCMLWAYHCLIQEAASSAAKFFRLYPSIESSPVCCLQSRSQHGQDLHSELTAARDEAATARQQAEQLEASMKALQVSPV